MCVLGHVSYSVGLLLTCVKFLFGTESWDRLMFRSDSCLGLTRCVNAFNHTVPVLLPLLETVADCIRHE
jgi:hypothetical protein